MKKITSYINLKGLKSFAKGHKAVTALIVVALFSAGYGSLKAKSTAGEVKYVLGTVSRGTLAVSVSGTGTVSASNQIDVKAKASGDILRVPVHTGQEVSAGTLLASIDATDALNALKSAQISMAKLQEPADQSNQISAQTAVTDAETAQTKSYTNALSDITSTFGDFPTILSGMNDLLYTTSGYLSDQSVSALGTTAVTFRLTAGREYDAANREYQNLISEYKSLSSASSHDAIVQVLVDTTKTTIDLVQALKDAQTAVNFVKDTAASTQSARTSTSAATDAQASLLTWGGQMTAHANALANDKSAIDGAPRSIAEKQASLAKVMQGADPLDLQSEALSLEQRQQAYNDTFVTAPISGVVGKLDVKVGDTASNGTIIATLITKDKIATISLNEVDAAKVKVGDKATMTFDAVDGLTITGTVSDIDLIGTVSQGVVNYSAKITFDTDDPRVLSSMSVNANVITQAKTDILTVPLSAVKSDVQGSYVLLPPTSSTTPPLSASIETGISNDTDIEVISGLTEGEQIVARTTTSSATAATTQAPSLFGGGGARGGGASGATRALGR